ncbi:tyrosine-type recombinase/integrase [Oceanidesulfovibrio marinus]|uniref:tyrosine-type recombinase/integrase n=1 Tax=Oceanidesulfovibrio marinus TaxID=370038 RepID=UPI00148AEF4A|nr:site-specific integrase [Oceanidesulfovibrio marinus]
MTIKNNGKKERHKIGWRSEGIDAAYASQKRTELQNQARLGEQPRVRPKESLTLQEAWTVYYENHCRTNTKRPEKLLSRWRNHVKDELGDKMLSEISPLDLEVFKATLQERGKSPKTIELTLALIRSIYRKVARWDLYQGNIPTDRIEWPRYDNARERWLTPDEARALLEEISRRGWDPQKMFWRMCMIALYTGLRFSEIANLKGEQMNLAAGTIRAQNTKSGRDRTVFITGELDQVLRDIPLHPGHLVFPRRSGGVHTVVPGIFPRAVNALGLNDGVDDRKHKVVFHTLRHTFGSWLAISGVPLYWISKLMGHSNQDITERYSHLCPGMQRHAVDCIDTALHHGITPGLWFSLGERQNTNPDPDGGTELAFPA